MQKKMLRLCFYVTLSEVGTFRLGSTLGVHGKQFFSNEVNLETAIDNVQQTDLSALTVRHVNLSALAVRQ